MKKMIRLLLPALFLGLPVAGHAEGTIDGTTIMQFRQDAHTGFDKKTLIPATQFLGVDWDRLGNDNLSAHFYGWGRVDLADQSGRDGRADGSVTYGYLQYRSKEANTQAKLGRFFVNEGIVSEQLDGIGASTDLPYGFGIAGFGGATVHVDHMAGETSDGKGDAVFGGRLHYRLRGLFELGLAGVYETKAPALVNPNLVGGSYGDHRLLGGDLWLNPHRMVQLMGHTSYNTETGSVAEHSYLVNVLPVKNVTLSASYDYHNDRDLFYSSIIFSRLLTNLSERSRSFGGSASYYLIPQLELSADFKEYQRDFGQAQRFGGDLRGSFLKNTLRAGAGYHYLRTGPNFAILPALSDASASYHEARAYALHDTKGYFSSLDLIGYFFKSQLDNRKSAWEAVGSLGYHLTPGLALSGDVSYGQNALFDDELRGVLRLTFNKNFAKGDSK